MAGTFGIISSSLQMVDSPQIHASNFELVLARAFDLAWDAFLKIEGAVEDTAENRGVLAARIVVLGKLNEPDEAEISAAALTFMKALAAARRLGPAPPAAASEPDSAGAMLDPEAIDVATGALQACLDELPEGIPSQARSVLWQSILENAGNGERNLSRLQAEALDALKLRQ